MANPTNKSYDGIITWATGSSNDIQAKNLITPRNIKITNNSNTQLATASFNGTADATLKLPASVGIDISGNAATATYANNIRLQQKNNNTYYPAVFVDGVATDTNYKPSVTQTSSVTVRAGATRASTSAGNTYAGIALGNSISNTDATNYADARVGLLRLFGNLSKYADIRPTDGFTDNRTFLLPDKGGTIALTSDIESSSAIEQTVADLLAQNCGFKLIQQETNNTTNGTNNWVFMLFKVTGALLTLPGVSLSPIGSFKLGFFLHCAGSYPSGTITFKEPFTRTVATIAWGLDSGGAPCIKAANTGWTGAGIAVYSDGSIETTSAICSLTKMNLGPNNKCGCIIYGI